MHNLLRSRETRDLKEEVLDECMSHLTYVYALTTLLS